MHARTLKGNMGYDQYTVPNDCCCRTYFCCFPMALANICPWPLVPFFQISLENRADKIAHNTFRDCCVHFFRQPFSKQLYSRACKYRLPANSVQCNSEANQGTWYGNSTDLQFIKLQYLYYYMRNFCTLIGLEQWYFRLIWNTYLWKLQTILWLVISINK